jgi:hypothetical protein
MKFELQSNNKNATKEDILSDVSKIVKQNDFKKLTQANYKQYGKYSIWMIYNRFGNWFNMLEEAGLKKTRNLGISENDLLENIMNVWIKLQKQPKYSDMKEDFSKYKISTYERRFGSWTDALQEFVKYANNENLSITKTTTVINNRHKTSRNINQRLRFIVMRRDNFKCVICGKSPANDPSIELHIDHIIPWVKGGETELENLQTLCSKCNFGKSDLDMKDIKSV